jgi:hypothetical protein
MRFELKIICFLFKTKQQTKIENGKLSFFTEKKNGKKNFLSQAFR